LLSELRVILFHHEKTDSSHDPQHGSNDEYTEKKTEALLPDEGSQNIMEKGECQKGSNKKRIMTDK
jgi:hypothetical protein